MVPHPTPHTRHPTPNTLRRLIESYHRDKETTKFSPLIFPFNALAGGVTPATKSARTTTEFSIRSPAGTCTPSPRTDRLTLARSPTITLSHKIESCTSAVASIDAFRPVYVSRPCSRSNARLMSRYLCNVESSYQ